jgi:hypothetical protein
MKVRYLTLALLLALPAVASAQVAEGVAAGVALDELERRANSIVKEGTDAGDYLVTKAGIEALNVIRQAEIAYERQLGKTVAEVNGLSRKLNDLDAMLDDAQAKLDGQLAEVGRLETRVAQVISDVPFMGSGPYVSRVSPTIVKPTLGTVQRFTISGVDLRDVSFKSMTGGATYDVKQVDNQTYLVEIPSSEFKHDRSISVQSFPMTLTGDRQFILGPRKVKDTTLTIGVLPASLGTYEYKGTYSEDVREERVVEKSPGQMEGSNTTKYRMAKPTEGWLVDITKPISVRQSGADKGKCEGHVANELSSNGVKLQARVDRRGRSMRYPNGAPGKVSCHATFTEYRMVPTRREFAGSGQLGWSSDAAFELPHRLADTTFTFRLFDGSVVNATGTRRDKYFELKRDNQFVVIKPTPPAAL